MSTHILAQQSHCLPRKVASLSNDHFCVLEYTPEQRKQILMRRRVFSTPVPSYPASPVPNDPHAMTVFVGMACPLDGGEARPEFTTVHVPGVLVESDQFVAGFHYGMQAAYEESEDGEQPLTEQAITNTFLETAADAVMLSEEGDSPAFSTGFLFGYMRGCTLIGTEAFQMWVEGKQCW